MTGLRMGWLACGLAACLAVSVQAKDWPNWRGPAFSGISQETDWQAQWPATGPKVAWRADVGTGFSSMSVADGKLLTMGHIAGQEVVFCLDAQTGQEIWKHSYAAPLLPKLHEGGPSATPTIHEGKVYTVGKAGDMFCLDFATGKPIWRVDLKALGGLRKPPEWGFCSSPVILFEKVFVEAGHTLALHRDSGEVIWKSQEYNPAYATPAVFVHNGKPRLASLNNDGLVVLDVADGRTLAFARWKTSFKTNATYPLIVGDKIFMSTGYNRGCALFRFTGSSLEKIYENRQMSNHMNPCVLIDGHLYGFDGNSHRPNLVELVCMELATGEVKWRQGGFGCGSVTAADGRLILLSDSGELVTAHATPREFRPISRARVLQGRCWTVPVLSHGRIYCRDAGGNLVCLDVR